jgi:hypothetical protein
MSEYIHNCIRVIGKDRLCAGGTDAKMAFEIPIPLFVALDPMAPVCGIGHDANSAQGWILQVRVELRAVAIGQQCFLSVPLVVLVMVVLMMLLMGWYTKKL